MSNLPQLILGTTLWGWTVTRATAFELLDHFYDQGFRKIDGATNYPINKKPEDFRASEMILQEWINTHQVHDLEIIMKVGSLDNRFTPHHCLTASFLMMNRDYYLAKFESNLRTLMIHWDNRDGLQEIRETVKTLFGFAGQQLEVGLSGIRHPEYYSFLQKEFPIDYHIQIKHNLLHSDYSRYKDFHGKRRFNTYSINAGGIKTKTEKYRTDSSLVVRGGNIREVHPVVDQVAGIVNQANLHTDRPAITSFFDANLLFAFYSPEVEGILIGPSRLEQLKSSLEFFEALRQYNYQDTYLSLLNIHHKYAPKDRRI